MFILASQSPSRKKILTDLGYSFQTISSDAEEIFDPHQTAEENAIQLARLKAKTISEKHLNTFVIGCDTIQIDPNGKLLEKPKDEEDAKTMMKNRSGKTEILISGISIWKNNKEEYFGTEKTILHWKNFTESEIEHIIQSKEWEGKCGGIAIEGISGLYIQKIEGSIANVMGFPLHAFWEYFENYLLER